MPGLMSVIDDQDIRAEGPDDTLPHGSVVRARVADGVSPGAIPCAGNLNPSLLYSRVAAIIEVLLCAVDPGGCVAPISLRHYLGLALVSPEILLMQTKNS